MLRSVLQDWVMTLPFRMQAVLISSLRGCDVARKNDACKSITRSIRSLVLQNADSSNSFIGRKVPEDEYVLKFLDDLDSLPLHFVMHTAHAVEIIGRYHPDLETQEWWLGLYKKMMKGLHVNIETPSQLRTRLGETPEEAGVVRARKHRWDAGTGTSHRSRRKSWAGGSG